MHVATAIVSMNIILLTGVIQGWPVESWSLFLCYFVDPYRINVQHLLISCGLPQFPPIQKEKKRYWLVDILHQCHCSWGVYYHICPWQPVIRPIEMGEMGTMYMRQLVDAGWEKKDQCVWPARKLQHTMCTDARHGQHDSTHLISWREQLYHLICWGWVHLMCHPKCGPSTKVSTIVTGQMSVKAPECTVFESFLPEDVHIVSCQSLHGPWPGVSPLGSWAWSAPCTCLCMAHSWGHLAPIQVMVHLPELCRLWPGYSEHAGGDTHSIPLHEDSMAAVITVPLKGHEAL